MSEAFPFPPAILNVFPKKVTGAVYLSPVLTWTTTPPTVPGWYWVDDDPPIPVLYSLSSGTVNYFGERVPIREFRKWAGPIPEPKERDRAVEELEADRRDAQIAELEAEVVRLRAEVRAGLTVAERKYYDLGL